LPQKLHDGRHAELAILIGRVFRGGTVAATHGENLVA
jgi:hypothetical protein